MRKFATLDAVAAPLPIANVDTDKILPGRFLKTISRESLGEALFHTIRFDDQGVRLPDFVLNRSPWNNARILIALDNFGCGSSREHAPWALADFGISCIIAPSFADIFYNNCFKNGILPIVLSGQQVALLLGEAGNPDTAQLQIDLPNQTITLSNGSKIAFEIGPERKRALVLGLDDISETLTMVAAIDAFEADRLEYRDDIPANLEAQV